MMIWPRTNALLPALSVIALLPELIHAQALHYETTPNGWNSAPRGWNSWAMQANNFGFVLNQTSVQTQCSAMHDLLGNFGYEYCSLDSGWSGGDAGDDYGRIVYNNTLFDLPLLANKLHESGMKLGIYILPGFFQLDLDKPIYGVEPRLNLSDISNGHCRGLARCQIDYTKLGAQDYCNSNIDQFASWGVDFIKLDFITPGSIESNQDLDYDTSPAVICYHNAIRRNGRPMRLDISWKLDRKDPWYDVWKHNADSMRTDQDLNNYGSTNLTNWDTVQRAIENYREYTILQQIKPEVPLTIYPDLDNLLVANEESLSGINNTQRRSMISHWIGAGANLILGSDMTRPDDYGKFLLTKPAGLAAANFTTKYPMKSLYGTDDSFAGKQGQIWLAGPDNTTGDALLLFANYGNQGNASLFVPQPVDGPWVFSINSTLLSDSGLTASSYVASDIWGDEGNTFNLTLPSNITVQDSDVLFLHMSPA